MFTGRSTVGMLLSGLVLPGTNARSGMNAPNGTFMKRLLSISHAEQIGCWACAAAPNRHASAAITAVHTDGRIRNARFLILPSSLQLDRASLIEIGLRLSLLLRSDRLLEPDDFSSNRHPALSFCLSMIFSEKPGPTFPDHALMRLVLSRPQHFADAQHVFRGPHIHKVGGT